MPHDEPLIRHTTLQVGGPAWRFEGFETVAELERLSLEAEEAGKGLWILGGGSNVLVSDQGVDGMVLQPRASGYSFTPRGRDAVLRADAGVDWDQLVEATVERGLCGFEAMSGIPGTVGGAPIQNIGAYGQELSDSLVEVTVWRRSTRTVEVLTADQCELAYRTSRFKTRDQGEFVILDASFLMKRDSVQVRHPEVEQQLGTLSKDPGEAVRQIRDAVLEVRRRKSMIIDTNDPNHRSAGSFFVNPIVNLSVADAVTRRTEAHVGRGVPRFAQTDGRFKLSAAWLIEHAGFIRGWSEGPVGLSTKHTLALVNRGQARASDIIRAARIIRSRVRRLFGVTLEP